MTKEEAVLTLKAAAEYFDKNVPALGGEAMRMAIDALRTRQFAAKLDRIQWGKCEMCGDGEVNASPGAHDFIIADDCLLYNDSEFGLEGVLIKYCPFCSRPLTEEAWAELERRIGGSNGTTD